MKICVCVKHVPDSEARIVIGGDGRSVDTSGVSCILNPYDEFAVEAALQIREAGQAEEVTVLSLGDGEVTASIRSALAMGADKAIHLATDLAGLDVHAAATMIADALKEEDFDLILFGKMAIDDGSAGVPGYVAALLDRPSISSVSALEIAGGGLEATMAVEGAAYRIQAPLPAVVSCDKGLNEPRFATLPNIMKARRKPLAEVAARPVDALLEVRQMDLPPARSGGRIVGEGAAAVGELVRLLQEEAKVL